MKMTFADGRPTQKSVSRQPWWLTPPYEVIVVTAMGGFICYWVRSVLSVAILQLSLDLNLDAKSQATALAAFFYGYVIANLFFGTLSRRISPGTLILGAVLGSSFMTISLPFAVRFGGGRALILFRAVTGILQGPVFPAMYSVLSAEFGHDESKRTQAMAVFGASGPMGIAANLLVSPLLLERFGWEATVTAASILSIPWAILWFSSPSMQRPLDASKQLAREKMESTQLQSASEASLAPSSVWQILQTPSFYGLASGHFAHAWMSYVVMAWLPVYLHDELNVNGGSLALSCLPYIATAFSSLALGIWSPWLLKAAGSDLWGTRRILGLSGLLLPAVAMLVFPRIPSELWPLPLVCMTCCLACSSLVGVSVLAIPMDIAGAKTSGVMFSMSNTIASIPGFVGVQTVGELRHCCGWRVAFASCTLIYIAASITFALTGTTRRIFD